jgi:quinol monooxygenase YgiN
MTERVSWVNELAVKAGKLQTFKELMEEMVSGARNQPGTLAYEWYISPDGGTVHVVETYADSAAVVAHHLSEGFALKNWAGRFMDCVDVTRVNAYGDPTRRPARCSTASAPPTTPPGAASRASNFGRSPRAGFEAVKFFQECALAPPIMP